MKITSWLISAALTFAKEEEQAFTVNVSKNKMILRSFLNFGIPVPAIRDRKFKVKTQERNTENSEDRRIGVVILNKFEHKVLKSQY